MGKKEYQIKQKIHPRKGLYYYISFEGFWASWLALEVIEQEIKCIIAADLYIIKNNLDYKVKYPSMSYKIYKSQEKYIPKI